jgi:membrane-anchored protein YejM (alkaline phosphatase superfamily)
MVSFGSTTYSKRVLPLVSWSHWFTFFNIIASILLSSLYLFNEASPDTLLGKFYLVVTWLSHMSFLTFIGFVLLIFPLTLIYPKTRFIRGSASIVFTLGLLFLLLDAFIYTRLGYHLNASSSDQIIALIQTQIDQNNRAFWFISVLLFISILVFQLVVSNYAWKHLRQLQKTIFARFVVIGLVTAFFISHLLHIWADANLEYDILRQDTVLPLSYPSTAKTLLTKYGMFDKSDYMARKTSPLSFTDVLPNYPTLTQQCAQSKSINQSAILVLTDRLLNNQQIEQFSQRATSNKLKLSNHIDNALPKDAWFNLLYSLPSIYKRGVIEQDKKPLLFSVLAANNLSTSLTVIDENKDSTTALPASILSYKSLFKQVNQLKDISSLVISQRLNKFSAGLHVFYFTAADHYQYELFIDALLLSQKNKKDKDIVWVSSISNKNEETSLTIKPALFILPNEQEKEVTHLTSHMDIQPTLMKHWLSCEIDSSTYSTGKDMAKVNNNRVIANTMDNGMMVFNKDKSVFIDQNGNFQSYSRELESPIMISADFPLMIDGVHFIKSFAQQQKTAK